MCKVGIGRLLAAAALTAVLTCGFSVRGFAEEKTMNQITVNTTVRKTGQYPEEFVIRPGAGAEALPADVRAEDFTLEGKAGGWGARGLHDFSCGFESAEWKDGVLTLVPREFPEKYFYVDSWTIRCGAGGGTVFTSEEVTETLTETADLFVTKEDEARQFTYHEFTPSAEGALPLVIVFHGYGDTSNLLTYRTAVEWAEPENQEVRPCTVLAPVIDDASYINPLRRAQVFEGVLARADELIEAGQADPDRIYVMGNSFGGMSSIEFAEAYPDRTAAVLALCPAVGYSMTAMQNLAKIKDLPVKIAHALHDLTIPETDSEKCLQILEEAGSTKASLRVYSDEEMNAAGAFPSSESTYSYHHVELAVMEDDSYMEWLFGQKRE